MTAYELKQKAIDAQYEQAKRDIERTTYLCNYLKNCLVCIGTPLFKETAEKLAEDGFDVKVVISNIDIFSHNEVSWSDATEGKKGSVKFVDNRKVNPNNTTSNPNVFSAKVSSYMRLFNDFWNLDKDNPVCDFVSEIMNDIAKDNKSSSETTSNTINIPDDATVEDYLESEHKGVFNPCSEYVSPISSAIFEAIKKTYSPDYKDDNTDKKD